MRKPIAALALVAVLPGCHQPRPAGPPAVVAAPTPTPAPTPPPAPGSALAEVDLGPVAEWFRARADRIAVDPSAPADDLSLSIDLLDWVVGEDPAVWERLGPRVARAFADPSRRLRPAFRPDREQARLYHSAGVELTNRPERDPAAEERVFKKTLLLDPTDADPYNHLAVAASLRQDYPRAERWAMLAIAIDPGFLSAYHELSYIYKNSERYADAVAVAERGLKIDGDIHTKALLLARQGQAHWMLGEEEKALSAFRTSRRLGGPAWIDSYLDGKQKLGTAYQEPAAP